MDDRALNVVMILGMLVLVTSSLAVRRLPGRSILAMALIWAAVFLIGALAIRFLRGG